MPKTRKKISPPYDPQTTDSVTQVSNPTQPPVAPLPSSLHQTSVVDTPPTKHGLGRGGQINRPSWQTSDKRTRFFAICVTVSNINFSHQKPMPIAINNSLPSIKMLIGLLSDEENMMSMLVDTGAAMNTGNKAYHQWVMSQCPSMVAEYIECGPNTDYDVVQILAALDLKGTSQPIDHGSMTAVIRYKTPYLIHNSDPLILSFALGTDVALRSVLGIPCLLAMGAVVDLVNGHLDCKELNSVFPLQLDPPGKGLPDGASLDSFSNAVPAGIPTNVLSQNYSEIQYTASNGTIAPVSESTYSSNIVVNDSSFKGNITRELVYHSPSDTTST